MWCNWEILASSAEVLQILGVIRSTSCSFATQEKGELMFNNCFHDELLKKKNQENSLAIFRNTSCDCNYSVVFDGCSTWQHSSTFSRWRGLLMHCCFMDDRFIGLGRKVSITALNIKQLSACENPVNSTIECRMIKCSMLAYLIRINCAINPLTDIHT